MLTVSGVGREGYVRQYVKNSNVSVAAGAKETLISESLTGIIRRIVVSYDGDNTTGSYGSTVTITLDGEKVFEFILSDIFKHFGGTMTADSKYANNIIQVLYLDDAGKMFAIAINPDSWIHSTFLLELTNADATNAAAVYASVIYDELK